MFYNIKHLVNKKVIIGFIVVILLSIITIAVHYSEKLVVINSVKTYQNGEKVKADIISIKRTSDLDKDYFNQEEFKSALSKYREDEIYQLKYKLPNGMTSIKLIPIKDYENLKDFDAISVIEKKTTIINVSYKPTTFNPKTWFGDNFKNMNIAVVNLDDDKIRELKGVVDETIPVSEFNKLIETKSSSSPSIPSSSSSN